MTVHLPHSSVHFGVDIGGTGIKAAPVDLATGELTHERVRLQTPHPATPDAVSQVVAQAVRHFAWSGPIGAAFPAAVKGGVAMTAANVDKSWIGTDIESVLQAACGDPVSAVNDADAAGVAEMAYGAGRGQHGVVIMTTFGTGIGTAVFLHGQLIPNTELGHLELNGKDAEKSASELVRERKGLSWSKWAKRVNRYLQHLEALFWPDLIIIGGGASRKADKFLPLLTVNARVVPAALQNDAGIVGAAVVAAADVTRAGAHNIAEAVGDALVDRGARTARKSSGPAKRSQPAKRGQPAKAGSKAAKKAPPRPAAKAPSRTRRASSTGAAKAVTKAATKAGSTAKATSRAATKAGPRAAGKATAKAAAKRAPAKRASTTKRAPAAKAIRATAAKASGRRTR